jgi:hypothetical protein
MSAPTQPTKTTIVTEALKRFTNGVTPTATDVTRAEDYGLEKVKRDIMGIGKNWRPLIRTVYDITKVGVAHYVNPSDFEKNASVGLMSGTHTGALSAVASTSAMTLAADENALQREAEGKYLLITSGTGVDQARQIDDYNATSKALVLTLAFTTLPVITDGYLICDSIKDLIPITNERYEQYEYPGIPGTPLRYADVPDDTLGKLALHPTPNAVFGLRRRYYADLMKIDTSIDLYNTILRRWANVFEQGVLVWKLGEDDDRYETQNAIYQQFLSNLLVTDLDGYQKPAASA